MNSNGVLLWAGLAVICAVIYFLSRRMKKQIEENGIETTGVISRIEDTGGSDDITLHYYARYRTADGEEVEGLLSNPGSDLEVGQRIRLKYHPKFQTNARRIG